MNAIVHGREGLPGRITEALAGDVDEVVVVLPCPDPDLIPTCGLCERPGVVHRCPSCGWSSSDDLPPPSLPWEERMLRRAYRLTQEK